MTRPIELREDPFKLFHRAVAEADQAIRTPDRAGPTAQEPEPWLDLRGSPLDAAIDDGILQYVKHHGAGGPLGPEVPARRLGPRPPSNDGILYVGLNEASADIEAKALAGPNTKVLRPVIGDVVTRNGHAYDLGTEDGRSAFVTSLGVPGETGRAIESVLGGVSRGSRGPLAQLAAEWAAAERGGAIPSRLVLSGHSGGFDVSGKGKQIDFGQLRRLAQAMPLAAVQIEDLHLSGCFTEMSAKDPTLLSQWREAFPNLKTLWGYQGYAAAAPVGHLQRWESLTRGRADDLSPGRAFTESGVTCWSVHSGVVDKNESPEILATKRRAADQRFEALLSGVPRMTSPQQQPAHIDCETYRILAQRSEVTAEDKKAFAQRGDQLDRLRHYESHVRGWLDADPVCKKTIEEGFAAVGLPIPKFATMTRTEGLTKIREFNVEMRKHVPKPEAVANLGVLLKSVTHLDSRIARTW